MLERFRRAMNYWMFAVSRPGSVLELAQRDLHRVRISFYIIMVFSILYSFTSWSLWRGERIPIEGTWVPFIEPAEYYLYQAMWTLPWMLLAWLTSAGIIYLFTCFARKEAMYEDALVISALSIAVPYLMFWFIPETFLLPAMGPGSALRWPELMELERKFAFPGIWHIFLVASGMRKVNNTNRVVCLLAGLSALGAFLGLYLPFIR